MLTERQKDILKIIVQEYIKLAKPVGSNLICDTLNCSSATIRSEMANLEDLGLLEKTHTSSGRIPSEKGYRYYVDNLMELKKMSAEDMLKLQIIFRNNQLQFSDCVSESLKLISEMTNYTSIKLGTASHLNTLKEISIVPLNNDSLIVIVVTNMGYVEHKNITLPNIDLADVKKTVGLINNMIVGTPIDEVSQKLEYEIKPIIANYVEEHEKLYNAFYNVFNNFTNKNVDIVGKKNILKHKEFDNIEKVSRILDKLEDDNMKGELFFLPLVPSTEEEQELFATLDRAYANGCRAVIALSFYYSLLIYHWIAQRGGSVPQDISVLCLENTSVPHWLNPKLSYICHPTEEIANHTVNSLLAKINNEPVKSKKFQPFLKLNGSTAPPKKD